MQVVEDMEFPGVSKKESDQKWPGKNNVEFPGPCQGPGFELQKQKLHQVERMLCLWIK